MISSDSHIIEPPDLWTSRIDREFRDRAPHVVDDTDTGEQWWVVGANRTLSFAGGAQTGDRFTNPIELRTGARFEQVRPGGYDPDEHLRDNATDGVFGSVLYPTEGLLLYTQADSALLSACCRAYNDFLAEFCAAAPDRLKGVAMLNIDASYHFTKDTIASILTSGLLGEQYVSLDPGGDTNYLNNGDRVAKTQSAVVLEKLLSQFMFNKAAEGGDKK